MAKICLTKLWQFVYKRIIFAKKVAHIGEDDDEFPSHQLVGCIQLSPCFPTHPYLSSKTSLSEKIQLLYLLCRITFIPANNLFFRSF